MSSAEANIRSIDKKSQPGDRRRWAGLVLLCGALFLEAMNLYSISVQIPPMSQDLHLSPTIGQLLVSTYLVSFAGFLLLGGKIADWLGRRLVFVSGVTLFGVASLAAGLANGAVVLIIARAAQGLGAALTTPAAVSIITSTFAEGPERNRAMGIYSMVGASGSAVGAALAGVLVNWLNWRWAFFDYIVITGLILALTPALVAKIDRSRTDSQRIDFLGGVLVTFSLLALVYSVGNANSAPLNQTLIGLALAVVLLIVFLILEANLRSPMLPLGIFRLPTLVLANIVGFTCYAGLTCVVFISTLYMQNALGYTPFAAGMSLLPMSIAAAVVSNLSPLLMNRIGLRPTMVTGMLLTTVGCALASWLMAVNSTFWVVVIPTVIVGSGLSLAFPAVMVAAMAGTPLSDQGFASGLISTSGQLGGAIGLALAIYIAAVFTPVVSATHTAQDVNQALVDGFHAALWLTTAYAFLGSLLVLVGFRNRAPQPAKQESSTSAPAEV